MEENEVSVVSALRRGGHKHPEQILRDLFAEDYLVVPMDTVSEARKCAEHWRRTAAALREALEPSGGEIAVAVIQTNRFPWENK